MSRADADPAQIKVRMPEELRARIEAEARKRDVSQSVEICDRVRESYRTLDLLGDPETQRLLFGFGRALKGLSIADGDLPWHENPALTWDRISKRLGEVYTFDHELERPWTAEELEAASKPLPTKDEVEARMRAAGVAWATPDELKTFQWTEPMTGEPALPVSTKRGHKPKP